ncbi:cell wall-binding repeat-containing protein [Plantactinospora sp. DSM 117369]
MAFASTLAIGATTVLVASAPAQASLPGTGSTLTASDGSDTIRFRGGSTLTLRGQWWGDIPPPSGVNGAAWAPDGSRAIFSTSDGHISTVRYNDGANHWWMTYPDPDGPQIERRDPNYFGNGQGVLWAAKEAGQPWRLDLQEASGGFPAHTISPIDDRHYLKPDTGPGDLLVYETRADSGGNPTGQPDVGVYDGGVFQTVVTNGGNPAIAPNGKKLAFIRSDGTYNQVWMANIDGTGQVQITSNAFNHDNPVWSPDGTELAFSQNGGVATVPATGSPATPTVVSGLSGVPSYQPKRRDKVARLAGANRFTTATTVSQSYWADAGDGGDARPQAQAVVLSRSDLFADALGGAALAAARQGPLLLTAPTALNPDTQAEIQRILAPGKTVYLLGSPGALSTTVEEQVEALGYQVKRLAGTDRFTTSIAIANEIDPTPDLVLAATGMNFPDALAAGAAAGSYNVPGTDMSAVVILTRDYTLTAPIRSYLDEVSATSLIFGIGRQGFDATEPYLPLKVVGENRFDTALQVGYMFFGGTYHAGVATGMNWPDALAGGALMGTLNGPLLLTNGNSSTVTWETEYFLDEHSGTLHTGMVFGSAGVVPNSQLDPIGRWLSGPGGFDKVSNPIITLGKTDISGAEARAAGQSAVGSTVKPRTAEEFEAAADAARERSELPEGR